MDSYHISDINLGTISWFRVYKRWILNGTCMTVIFEVACWLELIIHGYSCTMALTKTHSDWMSIILHLACNVVPVIAYIYNYNLYPFTGCVTTSFAANYSGN